MPPKRVTELVVLLLDVNSTANATSSLNQDSLSDFDVSAAIADSILCRKIFASSNDLCSLILFGVKRPANGCDVSTEFEHSNFHTIEKLEEVKPGTSSPTTAQKAIEFAIQQINQYKNENPRSNVNSTIFLLSNLDSTPAALLTAANAKSIGENLARNQVELFIASPDSVVNEGKGEKFTFMQKLIQTAGCSWLSFSECQVRFGSFTTKKPSPRGFGFDLKLDENTSIKLQMYVKNSKAKIERKFEFCNGEGSEAFKKHFQHVVRPELTIDMHDVDNIADDEFVTGKFKQVEAGKRVIDKEDLVDGYYYGQTVLPVDKMTKDEFNVSKTGKELNLIQFTSRDNILPQFLLSSPRYLLPAKKTQGSQVVLMSLVKDMLEKNLVAIVRYAYSILSHSRIACLVPKITKSGMPMFVHYILPQGDDIRNFEFKLLDTEENAPSFEQSDALDDFIEANMLDDEACRPKNTSNPAIQHECLYLRKKALDPGEPIGKYAFARSVMTEMRVKRSEDAKAVAQNVANSFDLQINENERPKLFGNRPLGMDPLDFKDTSDEPEDTKEEIKMEV